MQFYSAFNAKIQNEGDQSFNAGGISRVIKCKSVKSAFAKWSIRLVLKIALKGKLHIRHTKQRDIGELSREIPKQRTAKRLLCIGLNNHHPFLYNIGTKAFLSPKLSNRQILQTKMQLITAHDILAQNKKHYSRAYKLNF